MQNRPINVSLSTFKLRTLQSYGLEFFQQGLRREISCCQKFIIRLLVLCSINRFCALLMETIAVRLCLLFRLRSINLIVHIFRTFRAEAGFMDDSRTYNEA